jgi:hypothetical protein
VRDRRDACQQWVLPDSGCDSNSGVREVDRGAAGRRGSTTRPPWFSLLMAMRNCGGKVGSRAASVEGTACRVGEPAFWELWWDEGGTAGQE